MAYAGRIELRAMIKTGKAPETKRDSRRVASHMLKKALHWAGWAASCFRSHRHADSTHHQASSLIPNSMPTTDHDLLQPGPSERHRRHQHCKGRHSCCFCCPSPQRRSNHRRRWDDGPTRNSQDSFLYNFQGWDIVGVQQPFAL